MCKSYYHDTPSRQQSDKCPNYVSATYARLCSYLHSFSDSKRALVSRRPTHSRRSSPLARNANFGRSQEAPTPEWVHTHIRPYTIWQLELWNCSREAPYCRLSSPTLRSGPAAESRDTARAQASSHAESFTRATKRALILCTLDCRCRGEWWFERQGCKLRPCIADGEGSRLSVRTVLPLRHILGHC